MLEARHNNFFPTPRFRSLASGFVLLCVIHCASCAAGASRILELDNEVVCRVNTEVLSKRDIERRMIMSGREVVLKIFMRREQQKKEGKWDARAQRQFQQLYGPLFIDELREVVKERLMFQEARESDINVNQNELEGAVKRQVNHLQKQGVFGTPGYNLHDVRKSLSEKLLIKTFRDQLVNVLDLPTRPQIHAYYKENIARYQRKAGAMVRMVRIDRLYKDDLGRLKIRENARKTTEQLRKEIGEYGAVFADIARDNSDGDEAMKKRGGLIVGKDGSSFIVAEDQSSALAWQIKRTKTGAISPVFELTERSLAFITVEKRRPAGPKPLDQKLYDEINKTMIKEVIRRKENDWFRKALKKSLVLDSNEKKLPVRFFIPDDPKADQDEERSSIRVRSTPE